LGWGVRVVVEVRMVLPDLAAERFLDLLLRGVFGYLEEVVEVHLVIRHAWAESRQSAKTGWGVIVAMASTRHLLKVGER
jgi:hypothetical protein